MIIRVADADAGDDPAALETAAATQDGQTHMVPRAHAELLRNLFEIAVERVEKFAALMTIEMGKSLAEARDEVMYRAEFLRWFSKEVVRLSGRCSTAPEGDLRMITMSRPVGSVLATTSRNFPLVMAARKLDPALAAGCTGVLKPSKLTSLTALAFAEACRLAGVPDSVVNVVPTSSSTALTGPLLRDSKLRKPSFTGSTDVDRGLLREAVDSVLRISMELGGCTPLTVFDDADLDRAVAAVKSAKPRNMGEACNTANRSYVSWELADKLATHLAAELRGLIMGDGLDPSANIGSIITPGQQQYIRGPMEGTCGYDTKALTGGEDVAGPEYLYRPTVLTITSSGESVICEELFRPMALVVPSDSEEQVLAWASSSPVGLVACVHAGDTGRALQMTERLEVGMTGINSAAIPNPAAPFDGVRHSGLGREDGSEGIAEYLETIYVGILI